MLLPPLVSFRLCRPWSRTHAANHPAMFGFFVIVGAILLGAASSLQNWRGDTVFAAALYLFTPLGSAAGIISLPLFMLDKAITVAKGGLARVRGQAF